MFLNIVLLYYNTFWRHSRVYLLHQWRKYTCGT